jgi:phosphoadenosine phosphosulfate reductase
MTANGKTVRNLFGDIAETAIQRLKQFEEAAISKHPDGFYVAYSGGKDSDVILNLVRKSGVKYTAHHNLTTCDPPECVRHVKQQEDVTIHRPKLSMWQLIRKKGMPPRRNARYCCEVLKEGGGAGRLVVTGIRWGESHRRSNRQMLENCWRVKSKQFLNVIIDWSKADVWAYIKAEGIDYCCLYDEGFDRVGCVLCPMSRNVKRDMARWPKLCKAWEKAVKATFKFDSGKRFNFNNPQEYWEWWLDRDRPSMSKSEKQQKMFEDWTVNP